MLAGMNQEKTKPWTESYARQVLQNAANQGRSVKELAVELGVSEARIYYWRQRLGLGTGAGAGAKAGEFIEVKLAPRAPRQAAMAQERPFTVQMSNGVRIEVFAGFQAAELSRLLAVVEGR